MLNNSVLSMRRAIPIVLNIEKEIDTLNNLDQVNLDQIFPVYRCFYLFPDSDESFTDILFGSEIIHSPFTNQVIFDRSGLQLKDIAAGDIFIRAGQWASCVKKKLGTLVHKKFTDANTYSKTFKLGFRYQPEDKNKRVITYVKLIGCLECIQKILIETNIDLVPSTVISNPNKDILDIHSKFQRLNRIFHMLINMKAVLSQARVDIHYFKYSQGCVDYFNVEKQATEADQKLQILLETLNMI